MLTDCPGLRLACQEEARAEEVADDVEGEFEANVPEAWEQMHRSDARSALSAQKKANDTLATASITVTKKTDKDYRRYVNH